MEWNDLHRSEDIQQLMAQGTLPQGSAAYGIARQAIDLGFATLSDRQRFILDQVIAPALKFAPSFEFRLLLWNARASKLTTTDLMAIATTHHQG
jgi:hypothetical protein